MLETTYTIIRDSVSPRRREQLDAFLPELRAGLDAGEMPNARYTKAKEAIGRRSGRPTRRHTPRPRPPAPPWRRFWVSSGTSPGAPRKA